MFDREDVVFRDALDRVYHRLLYGDNGQEIGGYYGALPGSQTWEAHQRAVGRIEGIHICINEMNALAKRMSGEPQAREQYDRSMN